MLGISGQLQWIEKKPLKMNFKFSEGVTVPEDEDV